MRRLSAPAVGLLSALVLCLGGGASFAATIQSELAFTPAERTERSSCAEPRARLTRRAGAGACVVTRRPAGRVRGPESRGPDRRARRRRRRDASRTTHTVARERGCRRLVAGRAAPRRRATRAPVRHRRRRTPERLLTAGSSPSWAPEGGRIAFIRDADVYVIESSGHGLRRITTSDAVEGEPAWSPDGKRLAFVSDDGLSTDLYVADVRTKALLRLTQDAAVERSPGWSRDGRSIVYLGDAAGGGPFWRILQRPAAPRYRSAGPPRPRAFGCARNRPRSCHRI